MQVANIATAPREARKVGQHDGCPLLEHINRPGRISMVSSDSEAFHHDEDGDELVSTIQNAEDLTVLSWAAAGLTVRLGKAPALAPPFGSVEAITKALQDIGVEGYDGRPSAREAGSQLLGALVELVRLREEDLEYVRALIRTASDGGTGAIWLRALLRAMAFDKEEPTGSASGQGIAFVHACHLLALAAGADEHVCMILRSERVHDLCSNSLLSATVTTHDLSTEVGLMDRLKSGTKVVRSCPPRDMGTEWLPFATAAVCLIAVLLTAEDPDRFSLAEPTLLKPAWSIRERPDTVVDACLSALRRTLIEEGGSVVAQQLHLAGIRTLGQIAHLSSDQALRMIQADGLALGAKILAMEGADEEAVFAALWYLAEVVTATGNSCRRKWSRARLEELGVPSMIERVKKKYPRSFLVEGQGNRLLRMCDRPVS